MNDFSALNPSFYINEYRKLTGTKLELFKGKDKVYDVLSGKSKIVVLYQYRCGFVRWRCCDPGIPGNRT